MNDFSTYEFVVKQENDAKQKTKKALYTVSYILIGALIAVLLVAYKLYPLIVAVPFIVGSAIYFTLRYFNVEYEYSLAGGNITFSKIYAKRSRKTVLELTVKDIKEIAPYDDEACEHLEAVGLDENYIFVSSMAAPDVYYALYENEDEENCVVYFEATKKALAILKTHNKATKITETVR